MFTTWRGWVCFFFLMCCAEGVFTSVGFKLRQVCCRKIRGKTYKSSSEFCWSIFYLLTKVSEAHNRPECCKLDKLTTATNHCRQFMTTSKLCWKLFQTENLTRTASPKKFSGEQGKQDHCHTNQELNNKTNIRLCGIMVSMSAFLVCHQC